MANDVNLLDRIGQEVGKKEPRDLTPMQRWAANFAWAVFIAIVLISGLLYVRFCLAPAPRVPDISGLSADEATRAIAQYKELRELNGSDFAAHFDLMVGKSLLPVLATLVGYMLGRKK